MDSTDEAGHPLNYGEDEMIDNINWPFWIITTFWAVHRGDDGCQYPGGYETYCIDKHPFDEIVKKRLKYGSVVHLVNSTPISEEQYKQRGDL